MVVSFNFVNDCVPKKSTKKGFLETFGSGNRKTKLVFWYGYFFYERGDFAGILLCIFSRSSLRRWKKGPVVTGGAAAAKAERREVGRPRALGGRALRGFLRLFLKMRHDNKNVGVRAVGRVWKRESGKEVSERSLYRICERAGYRMRVVARKGILSDEDRRGRVRWARTLLHPGAVFWKNVCFFLDCVSFLYKKTLWRRQAQPRGGCG